jgi:hypothetical protein
MQNSLDSIHSIHSPYPANVSSPGKVVGECRSNVSSPGKVVGECRANVSSPGKVVGECRANVSSPAIMAKMGILASTRICQTGEFSASTRIRQIRRRVAIA